jgi:hypothetical protein
MFFRALFFVFPFDKFAFPALCVKAEPAKGLAFEVLYFRIWGSYIL